MESEFRLRPHISFSSTAAPKTKGCKVGEAGEAERGKKGRTTFNSEPPDLPSLSFHWRLFVLSGTVLAFSFSARADKILLTISGLSIRLPFFSRRRIRGGK